MLLIIRIIGRLIWETEALDIFDFDDEDEDEDEESLSLSEIAELASTLIEAGEQAVEIYVLEPSGTSPSDDDINRTVGAPIGITDSNWPMYEGHKMCHAITVDLEQVPNLKSSFPGCRAMSVFVCDYWEHEIWLKPTGQVKVLGITQQDVDTGVNRNVPESEDDFEPESQSFSVRKISIPSAVFDPDIYEKYAEDHPLVAICENMGDQSVVAGFVGGEPMWLQQPEGEGEFLMQFSDGLVEMNLLDAGCLYVYKNTAYVQG